MKVLPALRKLRRLHLALNSTADPSGTMILDSLASHSSCLQTLQSLSFDVHFAPNTEAHLQFSALHLSQLRLRTLGVCNSDCFAGLAVSMFYSSTKRAKAQHSDGHFRFNNLPEDEYL